MRNVRLPGRGQGSAAEEAVTEDQEKLATLRRMLDEAQAENAPHVAREVALIDVLDELITAARPDAPAVERAYVLDRAQRVRAAIGSAAREVFERLDAAESHATAVLVDETHIAAFHAREGALQAESARLREALELVLLAINEERDVVCCLVDVVADDGGLDHEPDCWLTAALTPRREEPGA